MELPALQSPWSTTTQLDTTLAAVQAAAIIEQILSQEDSANHLYNMNIPSSALDTQPEIHVVPMATTPWGEDF